MTVQSKSDSMHFAALDSLRGVAALAVVLYHLQWNWHGYNLPHIRNSFYFVDFFFVLSGFVMAASYSDLNNWPSFVQFVIRRAGRILPLHFTMLALFLAFETVLLALQRAGMDTGRGAFEGFTASPALAAQAVLLFGIIPGLEWLWNHPCWSIATEFWTYLLFGASVLLMGRSRHFTWVVLSAIGLLVIGLVTPEGLSTTSGNAIFRCFLSFFLGALTFGAYRCAIRGGYAAGGRVQAGAGAAAITAMLMPASTPFSLVIPYVFAVLVFALAFDSGRIAQALTGKTLKRLGQLSFSIYMVHTPVWYVLETGLRAARANGAGWLLTVDDNLFPGMVALFGSAYATDLLVAAYVVAVVGIAQWTYAWVEQPCRRWSRDLADRSIAQTSTSLGSTGLVESRA